VSASKRPTVAGRDGAVARPVVAPEVLEEFHRRLFMPLVRRVSFRYGLSREDARDIVQETFVLAISKLDPEGNPQSWLIGVVDRLAIGFQRKRARRALLAARWGYGLEAGEEGEIETGGES
jgi:DNA-directed RNA polymerase specialized sigma24 family protein